MKRGQNKDSEESSRERERDGKRGVQREKTKERKKNVFFFFSYHRPSTTKNKIQVKKIERTYQHFCPHLPFHTHKLNALYVFHFPFFSKQ